MSSPESAAQRRRNNIAIGTITSIAMVAPTACGPGDNDSKVTMGKLKTMKARAEKRERLRSTIAPVPDALTGIAASLGTRTAGVWSLTSSAVGDAWANIAAFEG